MAEKLRSGAAKTFAVVGVGGVGGLLAALLWKSGHSVICLAKPERKKLIIENGIGIESTKFGRFVARPKTVSVLNKPCEAVFIAVKNYDLKAAIKRIDEKKIGRRTLIIPLLNGIEHLKFLRQKFGRRVVPATVSVEAFERQKGVVVHTTPFLKITMCNSGRVAKIDGIIAPLNEAGIETLTEKNEKNIMWRKLTRLSAIALTTAASDKSIGGIRNSPKWHELICSAVAEAVAVARADGASVTEKEALEWLKKMPAFQKSSLARDLEEGRKTEVDSIGGAIVRIGKKHSIPCPTIEKLVKMISSRTGK